MIKIMMTREDAIKELRWIKIHDFISGEKIARTDRTLDALDMAIHALEEGIPKQVTYREYAPALCPTCGENLSESLGDGYYKHWKGLDVCPNPKCRQRLKW